MTSLLAILLEKHQEYLLERDMMGRLKPPSQLLDLQGHHACAICTNVVSIDTGDSPVTCSICKETCHRYCTGVSFNSITDDTPYVCVLYFKVTTIKQISEMKNHIETLTSEIAELRKDRAPSLAGSWLNWREAY